MGQLHTKATGPKLSVTAAGDGALVGAPRGDRSARAASASRLLVDVRLLRTRPRHERGHRAPRHLRNARGAPVPAGARDAGRRQVASVGSVALGARAHGGKPREALGRSRGQDEGEQFARFWLAGSQSRTCRTACSRCRRKASRAAWAWTARRPGRGRGSSRFPRSASRVQFTGKRAPPGKARARAQSDEPREPGARGDEIERALDALIRGVRERAVEPERTGRGALARDEGR